MDARAPGYEGVRSVAAIDLLPRPEVGPADTNGSVDTNKTDAVRAEALRAPIAPVAPPPPPASPTPASAAPARPTSPQPTARPEWRPQGPRPTRPRVSFKMMRGLHRLLERNTLLASVAERLEATR